MVLEGVIRCEGPECDLHEHVGADTMAAGRLPVGWVAVTEYGGGSDSRFAYCGWDCLMRAAAKVPPPEVVQVDPDEMPPFLRGDD